jgi:hypothetical protein
MCSALKLPLQHRGGTFVFDEGYLQQGPTLQQEGTHCGVAGGRGATHNWTPRGRRRIQNFYVKRHLKHHNGG